MAIDSLFSFASVFGRISPKISTRMVITVVAIAAPEAPKTAVAITVAIDALAMLTTLLPTRMVESRRSKSSTTASARFAFLFPPSA